MTKHFPLKERIQIIFLSCRFLETFAASNRIKLYRVGGEKTREGHQFWSRLDANVRRRLFTLLAQGDSLQIALFGELLRVSGDGESAGSGEVDEGGRECSDSEIADCTYFGQESDEEELEGEREERENEEIDREIEAEFRGEGEEVGDVDDEEALAIADAEEYDDEEENEKEGDGMGAGSAAAESEEEGAAVDVQLVRRLLIHDKILALIKVIIGLFSECDLSTFILIFLFKFFNVIQEFIARRGVIAETTISQFEKDMIDFHAAMIKFDKKNIG